MDEYIDQLLAEMQMSEPAQKVVRNILDKPIPETVKRRLLEPCFQENIDLYSPNDPGLPARDSGGVRRRAEKETSLLPNALGFRKVLASLADGRVCRAPSGDRPQRISRRCAPTYTRETDRRDLNSRWRQISACPEGEQAEGPFPGQRN